MSSSPQEEVPLRLQSEGMGETGPAKRRSLRLIAAELRAKRTSRRPLTAEEMNNAIGLCTSSEDSGPCESPAEISKSATNLDYIEVSSTHDGGSPFQCFSENVASHSPKLSSKFIPDDFDTLVNSNDDSQFEPHSDPSVLAPSTHQSVNPTRQDMFEARKKLSLLLATDNPGLLSSTKLSEISHLTSILKTDSHLSADQHGQLKLIDELPLAIKEFQENEKAAEEADNFFEELETNTVWATTLENEFNEMNAYKYLLRNDLSSSSSKIKKIDEEITALQSRRAELSSAAAMNRKEVDSLIQNQKKVAKSLTEIANKIEMAKKQMPEWEVKKRISKEQKSKILSKFAVLKGLSL